MSAVPSPQRIPGMLVPSPPALLLSAWAAETAWGCLLLAFLMGMTTPEVVPGPLAVAAPYGASVLLTLLLRAGARWLISGRGGSSARREGSLGGSGLTDEMGLGQAFLYFLRWLATPEPWVACLAVLLNVAGAVACLAWVVWWEMYPAFPLMDPAWTQAAADDARKSLTTIPALVWLVAVGIFLWWRGTSLARNGVESNRLPTRFMEGAAILLTIALLGGLNGLSSGYLATAFGVYALFGLAASAMARQEMARKDGLGGAEGAWGGWSIVIGVAALVIGFGLAALFLTYWEALAAALRDWYFGAVLPAVHALWAWIAHLLGLDKPAVMVPMEPQPAAPASPPMDNPLFSLPDQVRELGRQLFTGAWIVMILVSLYYWVRGWRWFRRSPASDDVTREKIPWHWHLDLEGILRWILRLLTSRWPALARLLRRIPGVAQPPRTMRELYGRLLAWGARRGQPRPLSATPREYQSLLADRWPALEEELRAITDGYYRARYGDDQLTEEELQASLARLRRITSHGKGRRGP